VTEENRRRNIRDELARAREALRAAELVRRGAFPDTHDRAIAALQRSREFADYDSALTFTRADAEASLSDAQAVARDALDFLCAKGLAERERGDNQV
jgi:hypothetical protein